MGIVHSWNPWQMDFLHFSQARGRGEQEGGGEGRRGGGGEKPAFISKAFSPNISWNHCSKQEKD